MKHKSFHQPTDLLVGHYTYTEAYAKRMLLDTLVHTDNNNMASVVVLATQMFIQVQECMYKPYKYCLLVKYTLVPISLFICTSPHT